MARSSALGAYRLQRQRDHVWRVEPDLQRAGARMGEDEARRLALGAPSFTSGASVRGSTAKASATIAVCARNATASPWRSAIAARVTRSTGEGRFVYRSRTMVCDGRGIRFPHTPQAEIRVELAAVGQALRTAPCPAPNGFFWWMTTPCCAARWPSSSRRKATTSRSKPAPAPKRSARAKEGLYEFMILDVGLPDGDGRALCRELREDGVTCPIILLTASRHRCRHHRRA